MLDKQLISRNFSLGAGNYEEHALLQKEMADELFARVASLKLINILDIGCGTGYLAHRLASKFPAAAVKGLDIAPGMIGVAKSRYRASNLSFLVGDGEKLEMSGRLFDLIVSNASLQWMDMEKTLTGAANVLRAGGHFVFNTFGPGTLKELKASGFRVNDFLPVNELIALADERFRILDIRSRLVTRSFGGVKELVCHLQEVGAHGTSGAAGGNPFKAIKRYKSDHAAGDRVIASFEVVSAYLTRPGR